MLQEEMLTLVNFINYQISEIKSYILTKSNLFERGLLCMMLKRQIVHQKYLLSLKDSWKHIIDIPVPGISEISFLSTYYEEKVETFWMHDCDCCGDDIDMR
jgi:hypothetical protein